MTGLGKLVLTAGLVLVAVGAVVMLAERAGLRLGRLPGDMVWRGKDSVVYFPLATSLVLSIVLTLLFWVLSRLKH